MEITEIEKEVIYLKAVNESIDSMVNYEILQLSEGKGGSQAIFRTAVHQRLFNIILVDFLSKPGREFTGKRNSCLDALDDVCAKPAFNRGNSVKSLRHAVKAFKIWLEREIKVKKVWLPSIKLETTVRIQRQQFIKICGDISKHNFSRLSRRVDDLKKILSLSGVQLSDEDGLLVIDDFYEKFHTDLFSYHGSHIVELLNDIRWGIHEYLQPEFKHSIKYHEGSPPRYSYTYPSGVNTVFAKNCYWALMNEIRANPYVKQFKTHSVLKRRC
jgi:hypothetical protein